MDILQQTNKKMPNLREALLIKVPEFEKILKSRQNESCCIHMKTDLEMADFLLKWYI